jgi:hypothetical protein
MENQLADLASLVRSCRRCLARSPGDQAGDHRTVFARHTQWLIVALQQRLLTTASPGSLPVPIGALVVSASLFTLISQIGGPSPGGTALTES